MLYSPITNLFVHNLKWSQSFFTEQMELFEQMVELEDNFQFDKSLRFRDLKKDIEEFNEIFLEKHGITHKKDTNTKQK